MLEFTIWTIKLSIIGGWRRTHFRRSLMLFGWGEPIFNRVAVSTYHTLYVGSQFVPRCEFLLVVLRDSVGIWLAILWVCAIQSRNYCCYLMAGTSSEAPLVYTDQFPLPRLEDTAVITQECGSRAVYWVMVVSADSFWVSNSIYFLILSILQTFFALNTSRLESDFSLFCRFQFLSERIWHSSSQCCCCRQLAWC